VIFIIIGEGEIMASEKPFGFLALIKDENRNSYLGALLVVDLMGRPVEFRVTFPIKPTAIQRPLYGDALEPYIGVELCGKQLINSVDHDMELIFVNQEYLLDIRKDYDIPAIFIKHAGDVIEVSTIDDKKPFGQKKQLSSESGRFQPVVIYSSPIAPDDLEDATEVVNQFFEDTDLIEPFDRIYNALDILVSQDERFQ